MRGGRSVLGLLAKLLAAIGVSIVALWWAFRGVDLRALLAQLAETKPGIVDLYCVAQLVIHLVRVVRWGLLITPLGSPSARAIFSSASVGIPAAMFLPLRLGELVRPAMISRAGVPFGGAMASVVAERLADGLTNVGLFFLLLGWMPTASPLSEDLRLMSQIALIGFGGACALLIMVFYARRQALTMIERVLEPISPRLAQRMTTLTTTFIDGLHPLSSWRRLIGFVLLTALYWGINGTMTTVLAWSYGIEVPYVAGPFAVVIVVFAVTIPAGPAFTGTLQAGFRLGLAPFRVTAVQAALVATAVYLIQIGIQALILLVGLMSAEPRQRAGGAAPVDGGSPARPQ
jgi:uncharacterized protein (TIRG00374 family)